MNQIKNFINKNKGKLIAILIIWLILIIVFVAPLSIAIAEAKTLTGFNLTIFIRTLSQGFMTPFKNLGTIFTDKCIDTFFSTLSVLTLIYIVIAGIGIYKARAKSEYEDIEHGSSDWCENGEQYKILDSKKGIILAEKNYLPVDKRGNVNVLVVGRIWFW